MNLIPDSHRNLAEAPVVASLSTIGADGTPQLTAVWFLTVSDTTKFSLTSDRHSYKNMISRPHATLFIIDPSNPLRTLEICTVQSSPDADLGPFNAVFRHYGQDPHGSCVPLEGRVAITLRPTHIVAHGDHRQRRTFEKRTVN
jgi:hypothetical protein